MNLDILYAEMNKTYVVTVVRVQDFCPGAKVSVSAFTPDNSPVPVYSVPLWLPNEDLSIQRVGPAKKRVLRASGIFQKGEYAVVLPHLHVKYASCEITVSNEADVHGSRKFNLVLDPEIVGADRLRQRVFRKLKRALGVAVDELVVTPRLAKHVAAQLGSDALIPGQAICVDDAETDIIVSDWRGDATLSYSAVQYACWRNPSELRVEFAGIYPMGDSGDIVRFECSYPEASKPVISVADEYGMSIDTQVTAVAKRSDRGITKLLFSVVLPLDRRGVLVAAERDGECAFSYLSSRGYAQHKDAWMKERANAMDTPRYHAWMQAHRATVHEIARQRAEVDEMPEQPLFSVVTPVFRTAPDQLRTMINSVLSQSYTRFELVLVNVSGVCPEVDAVLSEYDDDRIKICVEENRDISLNTNCGIREASGDYIVFVDHDDFIEPDAFYWYAKAINEDPTIDMLFCDEDLYVNGRFMMAKLKMGWNPDRLYAGNYVCHMLCVSRRVIGLTERTGSEMAGAQDYDLTFKAMEVARGVRHIPRVLYHWRSHPLSTALNRDSKPYALFAGQKAIQAHFDRRGIDAAVGIGRMPFSYRVSYTLPSEQPLITVVIVGQSGCANRLAVELARGLEDSGVELLVSPVGDAGTWGQSANAGVRRGKGECIIVLDACYRPVGQDWIGELIGPLARTEVGCTAPMLCDADGVVRSTGLLMRPDGVAVQANAGMTKYDCGYMDTIAHTTDYLALSSACLAFRMERFCEIGGFDTSLCSRYAGPDFTIRLHESGFLNVGVPYAEADRVLDAVSEEPAVLLSDSAHFISKHSRVLLNGDPYANPNLSCEDGFFKLPPSTS